MMEKTLRIGLLADFYGELLTDKQKRLIDLYYNDDLSLAEIADDFQISRQAVFDILKRSEKSLEEYESKLKLVHKFETQRIKLTHLVNLINQILDQLGDQVPASLETVLKEIKQAAAELVYEVNTG